MVDVVPESFGHPQMYQERDMHSKLLSDSGAPSLWTSCMTSFTTAGGVQQTMISSHSVKMEDEGVLRVEYDM